MDQLEQAYPFQTRGEKELLGQGTEGEGIRDDQYPSVPTSEITGSKPLDWSIDYVNGEFPRDTLPKTKLLAPFS